MTRRGLALVLIVQMVAAHLPVPLLWTAGIASPAPPNPGCESPACPCCQSGSGSCACCSPAETPVNDSVPALQQCNCQKHGQTYLIGEPWLADGRSGVHHLDLLPVGELTCCCDECTSLSLPPDPPPPRSRA